MRIRTTPTARRIPEDKKIGRKVRLNVTHLPDPKERALHITIKRPQRR